MHRQAMNAVSFWAKNRTVSQYKPQEQKMVPQ